MRNNRIFALTLIVFSLGVALHCVNKIVEWKIHNSKTQETIDKINEIAMTDLPNPVTDSKETDVKETTQQTINYDALKKVNNEVVGWLKVNNTNINYPVVRHTDNSYYLTHSFDKSYNGAGWVFMDFRNNLYNLNNNTIIYGHARKDGSIFGTLIYAMNKDWINNPDNQIIKLDTPDREYQFKIFSVYSLKTTDDYIDTSFSEEMINKILNRSIYRLDRNVTTNDKILTLSTCYNNDKKLVVHAKLINNLIEIEEVS